jgi:hypothetical protein
VSATVKDRDNGYRDLMLRLQKASGGADVTVGIHEDVASQIHGEGPATIGEVATYNEFGTSRSPRRSFVADWADENDGPHKDLFRKIAQSILGTGRRALGLDEGMRLFGEKLKGSMVRRMGDGIPPPNAPSTIAQKGSSTPGVDTGELRQHVDFKVTTKG